MLVATKKTDIYYSNRTRVVSLATLVVGSFCQQSALTWSAGENFRQSASQTVRGRVKVPTILIWKFYTFYDTQDLPNQDAVKSDVHPRLHPHRQLRRNGSHPFCHLDHSQPQALPGYQGGYNLDFELSSDSGAEGCSLFVL